MLHRWTAVMLRTGVVLLLSSHSALAQVTEHFSPASMQTAAGSAPVVVGFDELPAQDNWVVPANYFGLTIRNRDGHAINVVRNTPLPNGVPYGFNFVTAGQISSPPNVISSGYAVNTAFPFVTDNFNFEFDRPMRAAGLWIGSLGGGGNNCEITPTTVEFRDAAGVVLAAKTMNISHAGVIFGNTGFQWDNKIFYGVVSATPVRSIRVYNGNEGCDVISFDDVQFVPVTQFTITIDPGSYTADYSVSPNTTPVRGTQQLLLSTGMHTFSNTGGGTFTFEVSPFGDVVSVSNPDAATASGSTLILHTTQIQIDPQLYTAQYLLLGHCCSQGPQTFTVVSNLRVYFDNFSGGRFSFLVGPSGAITDIDNPQAASAQGATLILNNISIQVNPQLYSGQYLLLGHCCVSGVQTFVVIPNLQVYFDNFAGDRFSFMVQPTGQLSGVTRPAAATAVGNTLVLNSTCVAIDPGGFAGTYFVQGQQPAFVGAGSLYLISATSYYIVGSPSSLFLADAGALPTSLPLTTGVFSVAVGLCDGDPPVTSVSSDADLSHWQTAAASLTLTASDSGSGVDGINIAASGATTIPSHLVDGGSTGVTVSNEGYTNIEYFAVDNAGNSEMPRNVTVRIDRTTPTATCETPAESWYSANTVISCSIEDTGSGVASPTIVLGTAVATGVETAHAQTDSQNVCDVAGNCTMVGPVGGIGIDRRAPEIAVTSPTGTYLLNQPATASFTCTDGGSGVSTCLGTVANGASVPTSTAGTQSFAVSASDLVSNPSQATVSYVVGFATRTLHDETKAVKSGSTIPLKVQLVDAAGINVSAAGITVTTLELVRVAGDVDAPIQDPGNANPDNDFRFTDDKYIFNLKTTGLATGRWRVGFRATGDNSMHYTYFQVR